MPKITTKDSVELYYEIHDHTDTRKNARFLLFAAMQDGIICHE